MILLLIVNCSLSYRLSLTYLVCIEPSCSTKPVPSSILQAAPPPSLLIINTHSFLSGWSRLIRAGISLYNKHGRRGGEIHDGLKKQRNRSIPILLLYIRAVAAVVAPPRHSAGFQRLLIESPNFHNQSSTNIQYISTPTWLLFWRRGSSTGRGHQVRVAQRRRRR